MLKVVKTDGFHRSMDEIVLHIAQDNIDAAYALEEHIYDQVDHLAGPNFPRRRGRVADTLELVAHPNYVVVLQQTDDTVTVLIVLHVARQYP